MISFSKNSTHHRNPMYHEKNMRIWKFYLAQKHEKKGGRRKTARCNTKKEEENNFKAR